MGKPQVEVVGAKQLRRAMKQAGVDVADLKEVHKKVAAIAGGESRGGAPVRTGRLQSTVRWSGTQTAAVIRAGKASVRYSGPIHWGWPERNIAPNPWITRAAQATEPQWFQVYSDGVDKVIEDIAHSTAGVG